MKNKITKGFLFIFILVGTTFLSSCKKKCDFGDNVTSGEIKTSISVFPDSGYLTQSMTQSQYLITASNPYANRFKISLDGGITKTAVNYSEYSIVCYPMLTSCFAQFTREVTIDDANGIVKYTVKVKDCGKCKEERYIENYVVIRSVPDYYTVTFDVDIETEN